MSLPLYFHLSVRSEMDEAFGWYEAQRAGRGEDFLGSVREALDRIQDYPEMHPTVYRDVRRILIRRFPYGVYYTVGTNQITIIAVYHGKRDPAVWRSRI
jgi:plasmid stabilization system protein ParE